MMRMVRQSWFTALAVALALALGPAIAGPGQAAPALQGQARIAVAVFPDLVGDGPGGEGCAGCDGAYSAEDTAANASEPLPALEIVLLDEDGEEIDRNTTSGLANGRQVTFFSVDAAGDYTVEVTELPEDWEVCPDGTLAIELSAEDFDEMTGFASVDVFVWRACAAPAAAAAEPDEEATAADAEAEEPAATVADATEEATDEAETEAAETEPAETEPAETEPAETEAAETEPAVTEAATPVVEPTEVPATAEPEAAIAAEEAPLGAIRGVVFEDANENGRLDPGEYGIPGALLRLIGLDTTEDASTAGAGTYAFSGLPVGSYDVYLDVPPGAETTTPDRYVGIAVDESVVMGMDFGLTLATGAVAPTPIPPAEAPALPSTGVQLQPRGMSLIVLAAAAGLLGALGLALEARLGRRSFTTGKEGEDA